MPPLFSDDYDLFLDQLSLARGLYGNVAEPRLTSDIDFSQMGSYFNNPLAIIGAQTGMNWAFGQAGLMPAMSAPGRNFYDQYQDKAYHASRRAALTQAAQADQATYVAMLRGIAAMRGTPWGLAQQQSANVIAGDVATMTPILAQIMPELLDAMHGTRGSAVVLAQALHRGGRFGVDPVTGQAGLSAESVAAMAREVQAGYFAPGADLTAWRGMGMGQAGALYEALQNRGLLGRSVGTYDPAEQVSQVVTSQVAREAFVRQLAEGHPDEFARLRGRVEALAPGALAALPPEQQVGRMARTDEVARQALEALQRLDPGEFNRLVDRFDRARPGPERVATRDFGRQLEALAADPETAARALEGVRARDPARFDRLRADTERARPGGALAGLGTDEQVRRIAEAEGVTADAIRDIQRSQPGRFEALLRQFDAQAIARRMRDMAGAVGAMREIFGDMGRPNAPMAELVEGLNAMTQGGMATMNPADLERSVRTLRMLSRQTGMGLNAAMGLMGQAAATADTLGLDRAFARDVVPQAMAFGAAFGQVGRGDLPAWGRVDRDRLTLMDQQLRLQAAQSPVANQMGAALRLVEAREGAGLPLTPALQAMAAAIREGRTEFAPDPARPGTTMSMLAAPGQWASFLTAQGFQPGTVQQALADREANQRTVSAYGIADTARRLQAADVQQFMARSFRQSALAALRDAGVRDPARAGELALRVGQAQARALIDLPPEVRTDTTLRNRALGDVARETLRAAGVDPGVRDAFQGDVEAETGWGNLERARAASPAFSGYPSMQAMLDAQSRAVLDQQRDQVMARARVAVQMQTLLGGLGQSEPMRRVMDMIQDPPADLPTAVGEVFGGVRPADVRRRLLGAAGSAAALAGRPAQERMAAAMTALLETARRFDRVQADRTLTDVEQVAEMRNLQERASTLMTGGRPAGVALRAILERAGALRPGEPLAPALEALRRDPHAFPGLSDADATQVLGLAAVGGAVDPRDVVTESNAILAAHHLRPEQLIPALTGEVAVPAEDLARLRALQGWGIAATADAAGTPLGITVGRRQFEDVATQAAQLERDLGGDLRAPRPAGVAPTAEALRHAGNAIDRGRRVVDALLGDVAATKSLGRGGFDTARRAYEGQQELAILARDLDMTPAEVLTKGDRKDPKVRQFLDTYVRTQGELRELGRRLAEPAAYKPMERDELDTAERYRTDKARTDDARNLELVEEVLRGPAAAGTTPEQRQEVAGLLGAGDEGAYRRFKLSGALTAAARLRAVEGRTGLDLAGLRAAIDRPGGRFSDAERADVTRNLQQAGALGEGPGLENLRQYLDALGAPKAGPGDPGKPGAMDLTGELTLRDDRAIVRARGTPITPHDATPAVA